MVRGQEIRDLNWKRFKTNTQAERREGGKLIVSHKETCWNFLCHIRIHLTKRSGEAQANTSEGGKNSCSSSGTGVEKDLRKACLTAGPTPT